MEVSRTVTTGRLRSALRDAAIMGMDANGGPDDGNAKTADAIARKILGDLVEGRPVGEEYRAIAKLGERGPSDDFEARCAKGFDPHDTMSEEDLAKLQAEVGRAQVDDLIARTSRAVERKRVEAESAAFRTRQIAIEEADRLDRKAVPE